MAAIHPEFAPVALLACISLLLPLPWHWRARNVATLAMIFWLFVSNLIFAVDAFIWGANVEIVVPVWCDITTKLIIGANIGLPVACLCISIHLERVASLRNAQTTSADHRRRRLNEAVACFGIPIAFMGLHFVVQGHRFDIIQGYGCRPSTYYSIPAIFIVWLPPLIAAIGALGYAGVALRYFVMRRLTFAAHLQSARSALTTSRYLRLMAMAAMQMVWTVTATGYTLWFTATTVPIRPWTTWDDVHSDFGRIDQFLDAFTPPAIRISFYVLWWMVPISAFLFVAFFAFGKDAVEEYKKCFSWVRVHILRQQSNSKGPKKPFSFVTLSSGKSPLPISRPTLQSTTATDSTLPTYEFTAPLSPTSSTRKSVTTLCNHDDDYNLKPYPFYQAKAIGSYTDLSCYESNTVSTPSTLVPSPSLPLDHFPSAEPLPSPPSPISPPPPNSRRLRPLVLGGNRNESTTPTSPRPLTYPSYEPTFRGVTIVPRPTH